MAQNKHAEAKRLNETFPICHGTSSGTLLMSSDLVQEIVDRWCRRLRDFRSADRLDASTLLSGPNGTRLMSMAVSSYLLDWDRSDWVDQFEIEGVAFELAQLWPHGKGSLELVKPETERQCTLFRIFEETFNSSLSAKSTPVDNLMEAGLLS